MKLKFILIFTLFFLFHDFGLSQVCDGEIPFDSTALRVVGIPQGFINNDPKLIKIYFHLYNDSNGEGAQPPRKMDQLIDELNYFFRNTNFTFFYNRCEVTIVNSDTLNNIAPSCKFFRFK